MSSQAQSNRRFNSKEVRLQETLLRISIAAFSCIIFFTVVYTSIYKLFGQSSFQGKGLRKILGASPEEDIEAEVEIDVDVDVEVGKD